MKQVWKKATPAQMLEKSQKGLASTPIWKWLKRTEIKRHIKFWSTQV